MKRVVILGRGAADTIILLNFSLFRCALRAFRRAPERADFWRWVLLYRRESVPRLTDAISRNAPNATVHILRTPKAVTGFLADVGGQSRLAR